MAHTPEDEAELVARCREGDQVAFRRVVDLHHQQVYRTAYALTIDEGEASDITQEVFLNAWRALPKFRGDAALATWLTRLTLNAARDQLRKRRTRAVIATVYNSLTRRPASGDPLQHIHDRDEVIRALDALAAPQRQVIALRFGHDLQLDEIAEVLGCPEGTVKSRLYAALGRLRAQLRWGRAHDCPPSIDQGGI